MRKSVLVLVPVALLALAGCGGGPPTDDASDGPIPTVTITATPGPQEPGPDYGFTFFEEGQIGATFAELSAQLHYPVAGIEDCPYYGAVWNTEIATTYAFTDFDNPDAGVTFFYTNRFLASDDAPFPRNAEGVGVGSTEAEVLAVYPDAVVEDVDDLGAGHHPQDHGRRPGQRLRLRVRHQPRARRSSTCCSGVPVPGNQWSHLCGGF